MKFIFSNGLALLSKTNVILEWNKIFKCKISLNLYQNLDFH